MIDIHCHILPAYDDGANDLEEALEMARLAAYSGVTEIIVTPHFDGDLAEIEQLPQIQRQFELLSTAVERAGIPVKFHPGAEILCVPETVELAENHQLPTLGDTKYVLTEFYFDESFGFMDDMLSRLLLCGYRPVVAHPERYGAIQRDPSLLRRWVRQGCGVQLNKGSILGTLGVRPEETANEILAMGLAHLIASDAHGSHSRTPHMGQLMEWAEECCDEEDAAMLLEEDPRRLLRGLPLIGAE
jgi:protein-tyrosine phosphatase